MARRGFREGRDFQFAKKKGLDAMVHPAMSIPFFSKYEPDYLKRKKQITRVWGDTKYLSRRLDLEKDFLKLKGLRDVCDCSSFAFELDFVFREAFNLSSSARFNTSEDYLKYVHEIEDTVTSYEDVLTTFHDHCSCSGRGMTPVVAAEMTKEKFNWLINEENIKLKSKYPEAWELWTKDLHVFREMMNLPVIKREMMESIEECNSDHMIKLVYTAHVAHLDVLNKLAESTEYTRDEKDKLQLYEQATMGSVLRPLRHFDSMCKCEPTNPHKKTYDESTEVRELADNWKRRTLYRLGGD